MAFDVFEVQGRPLAEWWDDLLARTGGCAVELFLQAPHSEDLVLAAHHGSASRSFREIIRFPVGVGFPGLVALTGKPLVSEDVAADERYLRRSVVRQRVHGYIGVPVWGRTLLGSLHVAFRHSWPAGSPPVDLVTQAAQHLAMAIEIARMKASEPIWSHTFDPGLGPHENFQAAANRVISVISQLAGADAGVLLMPNQGDTQLVMVAEHGAPRSVRRTVAEGLACSSCRAQCEGSFKVSSGSGECDSAMCQSAARGFDTLACLPLLARPHRRARPMVVLGYDRRLALPTSNLSLIHDALAHGTVLLRNAEAMIQVVSDAAPAPSSPARVAQGASCESDLLSIRMLGGFRLGRGQQVIPPEAFQRRRSLTLLKILLTRYGRPVHREELFELLWPDEAAVDQRLNTAIHYLRAALNPDGDRIPYIRREGDHYAFNLDSLHRLDSHEFQVACDQGADFEAQGCVSEALGAYQRAQSLYAGDFLGEDRFSDWCARERDHLRSRMLTILRRIGALSRQNSNFEVAIASYQRALGLEPALEDIHQALMMALWQAGRKPEALRQYDECRMILQRELDAAPLRETDQLRGLIVAHDDIPIDHNTVTLFI